MLGAVASGLGVLSFVAFAGGVVLWTRFNQMGLPADHALGLVPKSELVATGAEFLVPAIVLALLIVVIAVVTSSWFKSRYEQREKARKAGRAQPGKQGESRLMKSLLKRKGLRAPREVITPSIVATLGIGFSFGTLTAVPPGALVVPIIVSLLAGLSVRACGRLPFAVYCVIVFVAVGTIMIALTYERTSHRLEVLPMAYSRSQPGEETRVEIGYFVAETSDRILFASQPESTSKSPNELREFPRSETDDLEIGELMRPRQAERNAAHFAYNLCERLALLKPLPSASAATSKPHKGEAAAIVRTPAICERSYLRHLANTAELKWKLNRAEEVEERLAEEIAGCRKEPTSGQRISCNRRAHKEFDPKAPKAKRKEKRPKKGTRRKGTGG